MRKIDIIGQTGCAAYVIIIITLMALVAEV